MTDATEQGRHDADTANSGVAVIGMSLRVPGANTPEEFWRNVASGTKSTTRFTTEQLAEAGVPESDYSHLDYVPVRGVLAGAEEFDAELFGLSAREAQITDPQQRKFLECAYEALESAGYGRQAEGCRVGVFAGTGSNTYLIRHVLPNIDIVNALGETALLVASEKDHVATRTAHRLDLHGPAITMQTSCSTSLVTVHMAVQSLLRGEADIMLAGGSSIFFPQNSGYLFSPHDIASPDGECRAFDNAAAGTVFGNGVAVVVLKRLDAALRDADVIHAVIRGSAINNDGSRKVGYTAPSVDGQAAAIRSAFAAAGVSADTVSYVETHGTATEIGDSIEVEALREAFRHDTERTGFCALGTLKPNIGHVDSAAGVAGLIKAVLALSHGQLPPSINVTEPNPDLKLENSPFYINDVLRSWPAQEGPRRAGVSAFGLGGTNAHVVLEEAPVPAPRPRDLSTPRLFPVSGRTDIAAHEAMARLRRAVTDNPELNLADVAFTLQEGRRALPFRAAVVASSKDEFRRELTATPARLARRSTSVGFMFSGQGSQWPGMAASAYRAFPVFRDVMDECAERLLPALSLDIRRLVCKVPDDVASVQQRLDDSLITQPVLFSVQYALAELLRSWGLEPKVLVGHSAGEYVAARVAGAMSLPDTLKLVVARARLMNEFGFGAMTAVLADTAMVTSLLTPGVSVAAINTPSSLVVSGLPENIAVFETELTARKVKHRRLPIPFAAHSCAMDPAMEGMRRAAAEIEYLPLRTPVISTLTGARMDQTSGFSADYWVRHLRDTVRFGEAATQLVAMRNPLLIEVGPGHALAHLVRQIAGTKSVTAIATLPGREDPGDALRALLQTAGEAWTAGAQIDWPALRTEDDGRRTPLPGYPFERRRLWLDALSVQESAAARLPVPLEESGSGIGDPVPAGAPASAPSPEELGDMEQRVADTWKELLGVDHVGPEDNFFALGGDSLLMVRLIAKLRTNFRVSIPLRVIAAMPTLRMVAQLVTRAQSEGQR
ncbi:beta-ketoacyl synthase N-terminal-like domain-containing protein [Streptomyces sp. NPDC048349]|uniref:type I polyketide synthase n=1 Tax=Streptomyces sp. NPDC048349 TaxID=3155486 RepID=UPI00344434AE